VNIVTPDALPRIMPYIWTKYIGRYLAGAMAQEVSRRPLIAEARDRSRISPCGIYGRQNGTGTVGQVFLRVLQFSSVTIIPPWLSRLGFAPEASQIQSTSAKHST
jgi:hypothetical protein